MAVRPHAASHQLAGLDRISLAGLAGVLADSQPSSWAQVSGKPATFAPSAHKATHQLLGSDALNLAGLAGKSIFVDRGDPTAADFEVGAFTQNGAWHDLSLAGTVPAGAFAVYIRCAIYGAAVHQKISFRKKGNTNEFNLFRFFNQVTNLTLQTHGIVFCDTDRVIQYNVDNAAFTTLNLYISGWFI